MLIKNRALPPNKSHWSEPRAAMNACSEYGAVLALPVVAQFRRYTEQLARVKAGRRSTALKYGLRRN